MSYFIFGDPKVTDLGTKYEVTNINVRLLKRDIQKIFSTSRVNANLFSDIRMNRFTIYKFFALELRRVLAVLTETNSTRVNVRALKILLEAVERDTWVANLINVDKFSGRLDFSMLRELKSKPDGYQTDFFNRYDSYVTALGMNGALLNGAPGVGKSYMAIALAVMLKSDYVIFVSPLNAVDRVWRPEFEKHIRRPPLAYFSTSNEPYKGEKWSVWHYESLRKLAEIAPSFKGKKVTIVLDESHNLNNEGRIRTDAFINICKASGAQDILWQSGTSIKALAKEALPLISTIDPLFIPAVQDRYRKLIAGNTSFANMVIAERLDIVKTVIEKDVLKDVNPPEFISLPIKVENPEHFYLETIMDDVRRYIRKQLDVYTSEMDSYRADYVRLVELAKARQNDDTINWIEYESVVRIIINAEEKRDLRRVSDQIKIASAFERRYILPVLEGPEKKEFNHVKSIVKYLSLKVLGEALGNVVGRRRIEAVEAIAAAVNYRSIYESTERKTVIFTQYKVAVERAEAECKELGMKPITVYGPNAKSLSDRVESFMSDDEINPLIATFDMLSTAVPLTAADTMLLLNVPFRDYQFQQVVSRISRRNGSKDTKIYICTLDTGDHKNITTRSVDILKWSQAQTEEILGVRSPYDFDLDSPDTQELVSNLEGLSALTLKDTLSHIASKTKDALWL